MSIRNVSHLVSGWQGQVLERYLLLPLVTRHIVGYKKEESDTLLKFLYDHIAFGADFQARVKWAKNTVVVWDVSTDISELFPEDLSF